MVLPLRLIITSTLALFACAPAGGSVTEPVDDGSANADSGVAPVEAEPIEVAEPVERRGASEAPEQFEAQGVVLGLLPEDCVLIAEAGEQRLEHRFEFPAACHFATDDDGQPRAVSTEGGLALIVESSKPLEQDCDTALRVVVLTPEGPRLSRAVQRVAMCAPGGWDEMMFHVLASDPVSFGTPAPD